MTTTLFLPHLPEVVMNNNDSTVVHLGVGIDTARYAHHVSFLDQQKRTAAKPFHFSETAEGYQKLRVALDRLARKHPRLHLQIRIDAAGQYAENLLQWLHRLELQTTISVGQPARNKAYRKVHYDKRKADPAESMACARFAIVERPDATPHNPPEFQQLRDTLALLEAASKQHTRLVNQLHGLLARVFPELAVHVKDLSASYLLTLLDKYPTPEKLARAKPETLAKIPHLDQETAQTLQAAAAQSLGSNQGALAEQLVRQKVRAIRQQQTESAELQKLVEQAWKALPEGTHRRIRSIPGIGPQTAAALVAKIVSIDRFETAKALIGYFGVFPEEVDVSGADRHGNPKQGSEIHMSRKGNDLVRRLLYTAAQCAVKHNPPVKTLFARLMGGGKDYNVAIGHCMAKLLRQVFALWKKDCDFDPEFEIRQQAARASQFNPQADLADENKKAVGHKKAVKPQGKVVTTTAFSITCSARDDKLRPLNFAQLRQRVTITQVLEHLGWQPRWSRGPQRRGCCPLHEAADAESRCFAVHTEKDAYCCHRCGSEGNALDLWIAVRGKPILEAAWELVETFRLEPPFLKEGPPGTNA
jgi:transposase